MADVSKINQNGITYNIKDSVSRNMESLDSTERVVGVGHDGVSTLYKKTIKYVKPANSGTTSLQPSVFGLSDLKKIERITASMNEYYNDSATPTGYSIPAPVYFNTSAWIAFYVAAVANTMELRLSSQYTDSRLDIYFTIWYTK